MLSGALLPHHGMVPYHTTIPYQPPFRSVFFQFPLLCRRCASARGKVVPRYNTIVRRRNHHTTSILLQRSQIDFIGANCFDIHPTIKRVTKNEAIRVAFGFRFHFLVSDASVSDKAASYSSEVAPRTKSGAVCENEEVEEISWR